MQFNRSIQETKKHNTLRYDTVEVANSPNPQIDREAVEKRDYYTSAKVEGKL
jgi:hypothetical protein